MSNVRQNSETKKTPHRHGNRTNKLMVNVQKINKYRKKITILKLRRKKVVIKICVECSTKLRNKKNVTES